MVVGRAYMNGIGDEFTLDKTDFDLAEGDTLDLKQGEKIKIGEFKVPPQQIYRWGYGHPDHEKTLGFIQAEINDEDGNTIKGTLRIEQSDANGDNTKKPKQFAQSQLSGDGKALPELSEYPWVGQDSRMTVHFIARDSGQTLDASESDLYVSVTQARPEEVRG